MIQFFISALPVAALEGITFNPNLPNYVNYATLGSIIAHEITHSLENVFLEDQDLNKNSGYSSTKENYEIKMECIQNQYSDYIDRTTGLQVLLKSIKKLIENRKRFSELNFNTLNVQKQLNGFKTSKENLADIVGLKIAYLAYENWKKNKNADNEEQSLPEMEIYTNEQVFWLSNSMMKCTTYNVGHLQRLIRFSRYLPEEFRVIGSISNQPAFSNSYNCSKNSNMRVKCNIFD